MTVTSAMKGLYPATYDTLTDVIINGNWANYVGKIENLGLVSGDDPEANYVQIPMTTSLRTASSPPTTSGSCCLHVRRHHHRFQRHLQGSF